MLQGCYDCIVEFHESENLSLENRGKFLERDLNDCLLGTLARMLLLCS